MSENQLKLQYLLEQLTNNQISRTEFNELFTLVNRGEYEEDIKAVLIEGLRNEPLPVAMEQERLNTVLNSIITTSQVQEQVEAPVRHMIFWKRMKAVAAIVLLVGAGIWFGVIRNTPKEVVTNDKKTTLTKDVAPGGNKAILTLGDNSTIVLDNAANGQLAQEGTTNVMKSKDGMIAYSPTGGAGRGAVSWNTLTTPRGGQYQLVLPDGSKVWLNAASSIKFPSLFTGNERKVEMTGEVYFEVAKNAKQPFKVTIPGGAAVEVLGTHFNVNAYDDEETVKTTLLEGKVIVKLGAESRKSEVGGQKSEQSVVLKPGEQAVLAEAHSPFTTHHSPFTIDHSPDLDQVMAWKNGLFHFENVDIKTVMRQISRWYDVEVEYKGAISNEPLIIEIPRNTNLSDVLKVLETTTALKLKVEGKKVIVM
ncbi:FecR family protein [Niastella sp. OAS944]|uniref:FecR family protein n=1 Tax=Niastella sp. OAS944 TaxID=2664089 RepID=UPI00349B7E6A|nr:ferric-dicitrate binding protein FerR (iron transport regulator) [Chitinophagaceae bacterium OAS944]